MRRPRLLDLFCGAGGAAVGYYRAGFDVVGVDVAPQPHYPFEFHEADALVVLRNGVEGSGLKFQLGIDAVHASPPCQGYSRMRHLPWLKGKEYPLLIGVTRDLLQSTGLPWVIENVEDSPLQRAPGLDGSHGVLMCGTMFNLPIYRHRPFEANFPIDQPAHGPHREVIQAGHMLGGRGRVASWDRASRLPVVMECDWMTQKECGQAIPPRYTQHIGTQLLQHLGYDPDELRRPFEAVSHAT